MIPEERTTAVADDKDHQGKTDKSELVLQVMDRFGTPSYEAWDMTIPDLRAMLKESDDA